MDGQREKGIDFRLKETRGRKQFKPSDLNRLDLLRNVTIVVPLQISAIVQEEEEGEEDPI